MNSEPDDHRLTAFALGELTEAEATEMAKTIAADPLLEEELREIGEIDRYLSGRFPPSHEKLLPAQRERILRASKGKPLKPARPADENVRDSFHPWLIPATAAAVLAISTFIMFWKPGALPPAEIVTIPDVTPEAPVESSPPEVEPPAAVTAKRTTPLTLELPLRSDRSNLEWVSKSILTDKKLPPADSVLLGEILNNFPLRLSGTTSISRSPAKPWHPDNRGDSGMTQHLATLSSELMACPWKPSARLLLISLRTSPQTGSEVRLVYHANPATVHRYRLLGFGTTDGAAPSGASQTLPARALVNLALEIEPSTPGEDLGSLEWSANGEPAPSISLVLNPEAEPSDAARFAALVCTWSEWLAGGPTGLVDVDIVAALARETASTTLAPERLQFLELIDRSIHLERE